MLGFALQGGLVVSASEFLAWVSVFAPSTTPALGLQIKKDLWSVSSLPAEIIF